MSQAQSTGFGRRPALQDPAPEAQQAVPMPALAEPPGSGQVIPVAAPPRPSSSEAIAELRRMCLSRLDPIAAAATQADRLTDEIERMIAEIATDRRVQLNAREQRALAGELVNDMLGLGPIEPLLADDSINDIMVNGPNHVFIERRGKLEQTSIRFRDSQHVTNICQRIAAAVGRRVDESSPMVDARLKDGSRVN
ncbi:MAG: ATPase, T2SS/T4P/T4SS family, partial [Acetobacteraceae bacterium]